MVPPQASGALPKDNFINVPEEELVLPTTTKKTTEIVVKEILNQYPTYDCSYVEYKNAKTKICIKCPEHGKFHKNPNDGYECQTCSLNRRTKLQTRTQEDFIKEATERYGDKFDYSLVEYKTARVKVKIICKKHNNVMSQTPYLHLRERSEGGCRLCSNEVSYQKRKADNEHFIKRSIAQHGIGKFRYEKLDYYNAKTKVTITCTTHGDFPTYPDNHWLGAGCPDCTEAGFSSNRSGILYVMYCDNDNITKIGITNSQVEKRRKAISKSYGKHFRIVKYYEHRSGLVINDVETELIHLLRSVYKQPDFKFDGYTECFYDTDLASVLNMIEEKLGEHSGKETEIWAFQRETEACTN